MIKRIIGVILAIASLAVVVMAVLHRNNYRSMVELPWEEPQIMQDTILNNSPVLLERKLEE